MKYLRVPKQRIDEVLAHLQGNKTIQAIKVVRASTGCGLKEAKQAVDRLKGKQVPHDAPYIRPLVELKSVNINIGDGEVQLDLEGLQLTLLTNMEKIGIETTRRLIELYDMLNEWQGAMNNIIIEAPTSDS